MDSEKLDISQSTQSSRNITELFHDVYFPLVLSFPLGLPDGRFPALPNLSLAALVPANIG